MRLLLFGATGMIGQGAMLEALRDPGVETVLSVVRAATGRQHRKLREIVLPDIRGVSGIEAELAGFDACLFCLGISSVGLSEAQYADTTHDLTLLVAQTLARLNPGMIFVYVSAIGADASERGRSMWARVRGRTENDLFRLSFRRAHAIRPAGIRPLDGIRARTAYIDRLYRVLGPVLPPLQRLFPSFVTDTAELGRALLALARGGGEARVIEARDIPRLARRPILPGSEA